MRLSIKNKGGVMIQTIEKTMKIVKFGNGTVGMQAEKLINKKSKAVSGMLLLGTIDKVKVGSKIKKNITNTDNAEVIMIFENIQGLNALRKILDELKDKWEKTAEC